MPQAIGVCALIFNLKGEILLGKRKNSYMAGFYGLPGRRVELNEPLQTALEREVQEETSLKLVNATYTGVIRENQNEYDFIHFIYAAKNVHGEHRLLEPEKCDAWQWFDIKKIPDLTLPAHKAAVEIYLSEITLRDMTNYRDVL